MKAYLQVYGAKGLLWPGAAKPPAEEARRLQFDTKYPGHDGFDGSYSGLKGYKGGKQIQGAQWLPVDVDPTLGPNGCQATIDFSMEGTDVPSKAAATIVKQIGFAQANKNPLNMVIATVREGHPEISGEGEYVSELIFLAKVTSLGNYGNSSMVLAEYAWADTCLDDENIASIYTPQGVGPGVDLFTEFKEAWDSVIK